MMIEKLTSGVITVGHGRGFVVEGAGGRLVITAAHCLPFLPPALSSLVMHARVFGPLLAPRGEAPRACATCRFIDPIANIAVLGSPDASQADDYKELVSTATALPNGDRDRHPVNFWHRPGYYRATVGGSLAPFVTSVGHCGLQEWVSQKLQHLR